MAKTNETRKIVLDILLEYESGSGKLNELLKGALDKVDYMDRQDKAFISRLAKGCTEKQYALDYVISQYAHTKGGKMKPVIRVILRMAVYQILFMDGIKDYAACSEAVDLAKGRGLSGLASFVNGVLRNIARDKDNIKWPNRKTERRRYLSVFYSMPEWIIAKFDSQYGESVTEQILEGIASESKVVIRMNEKMPESLITDCIRSMQLSGIEIEQHPYYKYAYIIKNADNVGMLPGFLEGIYTVQDVSSQLSVHMAGIKEGHVVADLCAAPGGKAIYAAILTGESGKVYARDLTEYKLERVRENAERHQLDNIECTVADATILDESLIEKCDVVICDAPCSGLGIMGRKADIRYNMDEDKIKALAEIQKAILANAVKYLKPGGTLVYSTCTMTKEENTDNRDYIINELSMKPQSFEDIMPESLKADMYQDTSAEGYLQLIPGVNKCDGFFISKYIK